MKNTREEEDLLVDEPDSFDQQFGSITWFSEISKTTIYIILVLVGCGLLFVAMYLSARFGQRGHSFESRWERTYLSSLSRKSLSNSRIAFDGIKTVGSIGNMDSLILLNKTIAGLVNIKSNIDTYQVMASKLGKSSLSVGSKVISLIEPYIPRDNGSSLSIQAWSPYSASGKVSNVDLVYVNYGRVQDFEFARSFISKKVVLVRNKELTGQVVERAQTMGAVAVLFYPDPIDQGPVGDQYPDGRARPMTSIERSSSLFTHMYPGDPTTPGIPSIVGTHRRSQATSVPRIPVIPVSAQDAIELLSSIKGMAAPADWIGSLPVEYRIGGSPSTSKITLEVEHSSELINIHNLMTVIPGKVDENVIVGVKRDAILYGGSNAMQVYLETIRGVGVMLKRGWKPYRNLVFAAWDGSDLGFIGTTEYCEGVFKSNTIAYIDIDGLYGSELVVEGSFELSSFINQKAEQVSRKARTSLPSLPILSNAAPFYHHLGVPTIKMTFAGPYGVKGSIYDGLNWQMLVDSNSSVALNFTSILGLTALKLVHDEELPFNQTDHKLGMMEKFTQLYTSSAMLNYSRSLTPEIGVTFFARIHLWNETIFNSTSISNFYSPTGLYYQSWYKNLLSGPLKQGNGFGFWPEVLSAMMDFDHVRVLIAIDRLISLV